MAKRKARLLGIRTVARLLGCSERTVERLVEGRRLSRPRMVGGVRRWFPADVRVYLYRLRRGDFEDDITTPPATRGHPGVSGAQHRDKRPEGAE